ncbi:MAG: histidinol-phosphatase HisJ family protein [Oscillospiraceae bacterium]|jgi:histidinol-phosphatase (PHP family)
MNLIDCHTHSDHSPDASFSVTEMCEKAISLGLCAYAITDHVEASHFYPREQYKEILVDNPLLEYDNRKIFLSSVNEITQKKDIYKNKLNLICGIELGQCVQDLTATEAVSSDERVDFIIGSLHQLHGYDDFAFLDYNNYDISKLLKLYFEEIYEMCLHGDFDVLGHMTYTLRYMEGEQGFKTDISQFDDMIFASFKALSQRGKGIEINTSGLRQKYGKTFPELKYVKMFREAGGEILSVGSDAHRPDDIGKGIEEGIEIAKAAGFKRLTYFKTRKPEFLSF